MAIPQDQGLQEEGDVPPEMDAVDKHSQDADKLQPHAVTQHADKVGGAAKTANDLGNDLKVFHEDVQRHWGGRDAEAVCEYLEQLRKGVHKVSDKAQAAKEALDQVSDIMQHVKTRVKSIAEDAKSKNNKAQKLIQDARAKKHTSKDDNEIQGAASEIEKLRADNKQMSGQAKTEIENALNQAEKQIDQVLAPLGMEIDSGLIEMKPAGTPQAGVTNPQGAGAPISVPQGSSDLGGGGTSPASAGGGGGGGGASTAGASGGETSPSGTSGPVPKGVEDGPAPEAVGSGSGPDPKVAKVIYEVGKKLGVNDKVMLSAFETGLTESGMRNLTGGDRDSVGVFQQRPSCGWGNVQQCETVSHAANEFLERAVEADKANPGLSPGQLAQKVQASAFPARYDQHHDQAQQLLDQTKQSFAGKSK